MMTRVQFTLIQIDNYGPWTVTPEPRREVDLQSLQARLYADVAQLVGVQDGYAFFSRFDNLVAVTNGLTRDDHERIQTSISNRYPVSVSIGVAVEETPRDALAAATEHVQCAGSAQDSSRREILSGATLDDQGRTDLEFAHFDVVDATGKYTDRLSEFDTFLEVVDAYTTLARYLYDEYGGVAFFVGGDNVIAVCPRMTAADYRDVVEHVREAADTDLRVGVGRGESATEAGLAAKHALEICRHDDLVVEIEAPAPEASHD
jgi:GTP cyclohydrolase IIa